MKLLQPIIAFVFAITVSVVNGQGSKPKIGKTSTAEELSEWIGCFKCHGNLEGEITGPSFDEIGLRYNDTLLARSIIFESIKKGSKSKWPADKTAGVPMPPYSGILSDSEINLIVQWIMDE